MKVNMRRLLLLTSAIFLAGVLSTAFAQNPCTPGFNPDAPDPCEGIEPSLPDTSDLVGDVLGEGAGNVVDQYGGDILNAVNLIQDFSLEGLLTGVCGAGGKEQGETSGVQGTVCDISDTYQEMTFMFENYEQVLSGWGKNLATDFLQYDLGMGSHLTKEQLSGFAQTLEAAIIDGDSGNEIVGAVRDIADQKLTLEEQNAANAPEGTPEGKFFDVLQKNPALKRFNRQLGIEKGDTAVKQAGSIANTVESGNIAEKVSENETMLNVDQTFREEFVPTAKKAINAAPSTRAAVNQLVQDILTQSELMSAGLTNLGEGVKAQALMTAYNTNELTGIHQTLLKTEMNRLNDEQNQMKQQINSYLTNTEDALSTLGSVGDAMVIQTEEQATISTALFDY